MSSRLKSVYTDKATGPDYIPGRVLKFAAEILSQSKTYQRLFSIVHFLWEFTQMIGSWSAYHLFSKVRVHKL